MRPELFSLLNKIILCLRFYILYNRFYEHNMDCDSDITIASFNASRQESQSIAKNCAWGKIKIRSGEYEGEIVNGKPNGYGRLHFDLPNTAYHGMFRNALFHGQGCFFFANGDCFEGSFADDKPVEGHLLSAHRRQKVLFDGTRRLLEGATPIVLIEDDAEEILEEERFTISAVSKGLSSGPAGDYAHCRPVDAKLAFAAPLRANAPLLNAELIEGKIAVVMRGGCLFATKVDHCQSAGAVAVVVVGCDNDAKYRHSYQVEPEAKAIFQSKR